MAIEIPDDWPPRGWVEDTPVAHLDTISTDAAPGTDPVRWKVANWDSVREIASSALPGQVRHKSGLSIGTGNALVKRQPEDYPWKQRQVHDLTGQSAQILLAPEGATEIPTGQFQVAETGGDITTLGVQVDLDERQIDGRTKTANVLGSQFVSTQQIDDVYFDPAWLIEQLAHQMGYGVGVRSGEFLPDGEVYLPILDVPFQGSMVPETPASVDFTEFAGVEGAFAELANEGIIGLTPRPANTSAHVEYRLRTSIAETTTFTMDLLGRARLGWKDADGASVGWVRIWNRTDAPASTPGTPEEKVTLQVGSTGANGTGNASATGTFNFGPPPDDRPYGIQVQLEITAATTRARARRGEGSAWSAWVSNPNTNVLSTTAEYGIEVYSDNITTPTPTLTVISRLAAIDASSGFGDDGPWLNTQGTEGRIYLEPLGGTSISPWLNPDLTVWNAMQEIVEAWQAALITDVYGSLRLLNRFSLVGVGTGVEKVLDVGTRFEDLPWQMNYADQADRLVVKYRPVVDNPYDGTPPVPIVWELQDVFRVNPGSNELFFTLDYVFPLDLQILPFVRKDGANPTLGHTWDAWRNADGTGDHIAPDTQLNMRIDRVTSSAWKVFMESLSGSRFFMVDNTGSPYLKIRSKHYLDQTIEQTIERGLPASEATNVLEIDLSNYVQQAADANTLADFIWGRVNRRSWRVSTVNAVPDYSIDLGDVREMVHSRTGVRVNVLVSKVELSGEPGSLSQRLDLILIPSTWEDFDEAWGVGYHTSPPGSWNEFDLLWDAYTWEDFDRAPIATTVLQIEEGM